MSDLQQTQAAWSKLFREAGLFLAPIKYLTDVARRFRLRPTRTQVLEENDTNASTSGWVLSGAIIGTNTDEDGILYIRIADETPGAGQARVSLYKAAGGGGGDKVAEGDGNNSTTVALAEQNSSGLSGTVAIAVVAASESDDKHRLRVYPDFALRSVTFDRSEPEHAELESEYLTACAAAEAAIEGAIGTWESAFRAYIRARWATFNRASEPTGDSLINKDTDDDSGLITTIFTGLLELGRDNMADETTAAAQTVIRNTSTVAAPVFDAQNQGAGTMATPTMEEWTPDGLVTLVCTDASIGSESFGVTMRRDDTGAVVRASNDLTVGRQYADPIIGIRSALLVRAPTLTGAANDFGVVGDWTIAGETALNSDDGTIYLKIEASAPAGTFRVNGFSASSAVAAVQVFTTAFAAAAATPAIQEVNGSGISGTAKLGAAPTDTNTGNINLNTFRTQNTNGVPDKLTIDVSVASRGEFQGILADLVGYRLNSAAAGAETIDDSFASAGTFPPYEVRDA